jgi:hypothetical protein
VRLLTLLAAATLVVVVVAVAWFFRYEPMPPQDAVWGQVWDRWRGRVCLTPRPPATNVQGIACSASEVAVLAQQMQAERNAREERERPAREAAERANKEYWAQQQAELEREKKAKVIAAEKAEALQKTIYSYVQLRDFVGAPNKWQITKMRTDGHSEQYISQQVMPYRNKLLAAGAPKEIADEYFGGDPFLKPGSKP